MKLETIQQAIPSSSPWVVFVGAQVAAFFNFINPILQGLSFAVAIALGVLQGYFLWKKRKK